MIITYNPTAGAYTRNYRQELRRALRPLGAGIVLMLDAKLPKGRIVIGIPADRWDASLIREEVARLVLHHFLSPNQEVTTLA